MKASQLFAHWRKVRSDLTRALHLLEDRRRAFVPAPGLWSLGTVAWPIVEAEVSWFRTAIGGQPDEEVNSGPEPTTTMKEIKAGLASTHEPILAIWRPLTRPTWDTRSQRPEAKRSRCTPSSGTWWNPRSATTASPI